MQCFELPLRNERTLIRDYLSTLEMPKMRRDLHLNYAVELTFRDERINCHPNDY
jgi:hypothetical protein